MKVGIVGMPNAGKSTLFNALTQAGAESAGYPFTTIEPNVAIAPVPDERLEEVCETVGATPIVHESLEVHDIAGLVKGAHAGEGLGNQFLASIRETDAICHVVRAHSDDGVPHPDGSVDPVSDAEMIEAELMLSDLEQAQRRLERVAKQAKAMEKEAIAERDWLEQVVAALERGEPVRSVPAPDAAAGAVRNLQALTSKPVLYVANVDEGVADPPEDLVAHAAAGGDQAIALSAKIEAELAELDAGDAAALREDLGLEQSGLARMLAAAYSLLDLISFFTAGEAVEGRAWSLRKGLTAWHAAGRIHTDIADGFVKAEVIGWSELVDAGGYAAARERGTLRIEGRDYVMRDGEVLTVKHT
ncbi:MAG TPA: redox-regulated ATPase YchF [Solirubrobacterales bacterium]|nr:redox-regulated ATPase YchF [Solirubrobacterales bacterium]